MSKNAVALLFNSQTVNETYFKLKRLVQHNIDADVLIFAANLEFPAEHIAEAMLNNVINKFSRKLNIRVIWIDQLLRDNTIYPAYKDSRVNDGRSYTEIIKVFIPTLDEVISYSRIIYIGHFIDIDESFTSLFNYKFEDGILLAMPRYCKTLESEALYFLKKDLAKTELANKPITEFKNSELIIYNYSLFKELYRKNAANMTNAFLQILKFQRLHSTLLYEQTLLNLFYPSSVITYAKYYGNTKKQISNYFDIINNCFTNKLNNTNTDTEPIDNDTITYIPDTKEIEVVEHELIINEDKPSVTNEIVTTIKLDSTEQTEPTRDEQIPTPETVEKSNKKWKKPIKTKHKYDTALDKVNLEKLKAPTSKKQKARKKSTKAS